MQNPYFRKFVLLFTLVSFTNVESFSQEQNFTNNYNLSICKGTIPNQFKTSVSERIKGDINQDNSVKKDLKINTKFYEKYRYNQNKILVGGKILFGDEMTIYVNKIAHKLLSNSSNESLINKLNFYVIKSDVVNAFCMPDGTIFVTVGLLSQIENEAQLAFTLAHEITHFINQHGIKDYRSTLDVVKEFKKSDLTYNDAIKTLSDFSKENELESDKDGFKMFIKAGYDPGEAKKMLLVLQYSYLPFDEIKFDSDFFNDGKYVLPSSYFSKKKLEETIEDNSDEDDTYSSHPNIETRVEKLENKNNKSGVTNFFDISEFEYINTKARFENQYIHLVEKNFIRAVYESYLLKKQFPNNTYLDKCIAKGLYGVSKMNSVRNNGSFNNYEKEVNEGNLSELFTLFNTTMKDIELNILALRQLIKLDDKTLDPFIDDLIFDLVKEQNFEYNDFLFEISLDSANKKVKTSFKMLSEDEYNELTKIEKINYNDNKKNHLLLSDTNLQDENSEYYKLAFLELKGDTSLRAKFKKVEEDDDIRFFSDLDYKDQRKINKKRTKQTYQFVKKEIDSILIFTPNYETYDKKDRILVKKSLESQEKLSKTIEDLSLESEVSFKSLNLFNIENMTSVEINNLFILNEWKDEMNESYRAKMLSMTQVRANKVFQDFGYKNIMISGVYSHRIRKQFLRSVFLPALSLFGAPGLLPFAVYHGFQPEYLTIKYVKILDENGYLIFNKILTCNDKINYKLDEIYFQDVFNQIVIKK